MYTEEDMLNAFITGFMVTSWKFNGDEIEISRDNREYMKEEFAAQLKRGLRGLDYWFPEENMEEEE